jgi:hypothetical protein
LAFTERRVKKKADQLLDASGINERQISGTTRRGFLCPNLGGSGMAGIGGERTVRVLYQRSRSRSGYFKGLPIVTRVAA